MRVVSNRGSRELQNKVRNKPKHPNVRVRQKRYAKIALFTIFVLVILSGAGFAGWFYWLTTYAAFDYRLQPIVILEGQTVEAVDFLDFDDEANDVSVHFKDPTFKPVEGRQDVLLTLTRGMRTIDTTATVSVLSTINEFHHEFTESDPDLHAFNFVLNPEAAAGTQFDVRFLQEPLPFNEYPVGEFTLFLSLNNAPFEVTLFVEDTTPPSAIGIDKLIKIGEDVIPEDFVTDVFDASHDSLNPPSITFVNEPDVFSRSRDSQIVVIKIEDKYGNYELINSSLSILLNNNPPIIEGTPDIINAMIGNPILYRQGVTAHDDLGREVELNIESNNVDVNTTGTYTVTYWAEDLTGLRTDIKVDVHVLNVDPDDINSQVDGILSRILNDNMTQARQAQEIHRYIRGNVRYTGGRGRPDSVYEGASLALQRRNGNCFIYYALAEVMLTRAGIPNIPITRTPGFGSMHYWNLINPDELGWHHFDSMPFPSVLGVNPQMYMFTNSRSVYFANLIASRHGGTTYFTFDPELYPEIVEG